MAIKFIKIVDLSLYNNLFITKKVFFLIQITENATKDTEITANNMFIKIIDFKSRKIHFVVSFNIVYFVK